MNPTNKWYCRNCEDLTEHLWLHDCAHGIPETHMANSERFVCIDCKLTTFAHSEGCYHFSFMYDVSP